MAGYLVLAFVLKAVQRRSPISDKVVANVPVMIWNAGTFATSVMLLIGISDHPEVLRVIGDTTPFLLFVAFMGLVYGFIGLVRPD